MNVDPNIVSAHYGSDHYSRFIYSLFDDFSAKISCNFFIISPVPYIYGVQIIVLSLHEAHGM